MPARWILTLLIVASACAGAAHAEQFARIGNMIGEYARFSPDARGEAMGPPPSGGIRRPCPSRRG